MRSPIAFLAMLLCCVAGTQAQPSDDAPTYDTGFTAATRIGAELYGSLNSKYQKVVHSRPVALETDVAPFVKTVEYPDDKEPLRLVFISVGFIDLINNVSHAKAIDKIEPGYFQKYVVSLAQETGDISFAELPGISNKKYWSEDVLNEQKSNFNQMTGLLVAVELSHHYLGHFKKYESQLEANGKTVPINNVLTSAEWEQAMRAGLINALECGYGIDGLKALYDSIDKMPRRPAWTAYFIPETMKVAELKKQLEKAEAAFFRGQLKP
jgi:hypothetical protein